MISNGKAPGRHWRGAGQYRPSPAGAGHGAAALRRLRTERVQRPLPGLSPGQGAGIRLRVL